MSGEFEFTVGMLGQYDIENRTVTDPLREDPGARAAYSARPRFTQGADEAHPIASAKDSLLADVEIAEALEAVQLAAEHGEENIPLETLDADAALNGLKWLRRNMGSDSEVRRAAIDTKDGIKLRQEQRAAQQTSGTGSETKPAPAASGEKTGDTRKTNRERQQAHHADREAQFAYVADNVPEAFKDIDFSHIFALVDQVRSRAKADGTFSVEANGAFQALVEERVTAYLQDPAALMNDFNAMVAWHVIEKTTPDRDLGIVFAYGEKIEGSLLAQLRTKAYTDFSDETIDAWYAVVEDQPEGELYSGSPLTRPQVAQQILSKSGVLVNSLYYIGNRNPFEFIDRMHAFARKGLTSGNRDKEALAGNVLDACLAQPFAGILLNQAATQMEAGSLTQQQALDLCVTLDGLGVAKHVSEGNLDVRQLTPEQVDLIRTLYPMNSYAGISIGTSRVGLGLGSRPYRQPRSEDVLTRGFKDKSASGEIDTIYGTLVRRKEIPLGRPEA